jgi:hypothetical protein
MSQIQDKDKNAQCVTNVTNSSPSDRVDTGADSNSTFRRIFGWKTTSLICHKGFENLISITDLLLNPFEVLHLG